MKTKKSYYKYRIMHTKYRYVSPVSNVEHYRDDEKASKYEDDKSDEEEDA